MDLSINDSGQTAVQIMDMIEGKIVYTQTFDLKQGRQVITLEDISELKQGYYIYQIVSPTETFTGKLFKIKP